MEVHLLMLQTRSQSLVVAMGVNTRVHDLWRAVRPATTMTSWYVRPGGWTKLGGVQLDAQGLEYSSNVCCATRRVLQPRPGIVAALRILWPHFHLLMVGYKRLAVLSAIVEGHSIHPCCCCGNHFNDWSMVMSQGIRSSEGALSV